METILEVEKYDFLPAAKKITSAAAIQEWEASHAYQLYLGFIMSISENIVGKKLTDEVPVSENCNRIIDLLNTFKNYSLELPPVEMQARYGNPAYRDWLEKLENSVEDLLETTLPQEYHPAIQELMPYLLDSFGNWTRIDYGTGHEMAFVMFVCCLFKIGFLTEADKAAVGLKLFDAYFDLARHLQQSYRMEPAGSMGVWNLDDYQFVAFIFGAAQLSKNSRVKPKSIPDPEIADLLKKDFHFYKCLAYIHQVKTGPFHEHSNQLWNISGVQLWTKVYTGLIKMYRAEVLCKFPVIQHTLFGAIFSLDAAKVKLDIPGNDRPPAGPRMPVPMAGPIPGMMPGMMMPGAAGSMLPPMGRMPPPTSAVGGTMPSIGRMPGAGKAPTPLITGAAGINPPTLPQPKPSTDITPPISTDNAEPSLSPAIEPNQETSEG
eukprot:TRINITY_DN10010_c0_g2_i1.p1 TRINITY_DN10010_c0_g2~~TRINITY_DN10010_c0_g2_i1.p1  ORF type:complete len:433 (-),score=45.48 TRINITY_DN10010_c0_g2_i1:131-1429(-)